MNYTAKYQEMKSVFIQDNDILKFSKEGISCKWAHFQSENINILSRERYARLKLKSSTGSLNDEFIDENRSFTYPVFYKDNLCDRQHDPIILLHGLNERSWLKYLVWALYLTNSTSRPVILFPIAFHMNRSPLIWGSPRAMASVLETRREKMGTAMLTTVANVALSERLSEDPLRFFTSGQQSAADIVQLINQLKTGQHSILPESRNVDFFAYSIGAFLAQIMMIGNPEKHLTDSRFFLFCGGAFFDQMNGVSKLIMDQPAFDTLRRFYIHELDNEILQSSALRQSLVSTDLGQAFMAMLSCNYSTLLRNDALFRLKDQVMTLALENDKVIPATGVFQAMGLLKTTSIMDFPFHYIHENPFPIYSDSHESALVDESFEKVFSLAASFLS